MEFRKQRFLRGRGLVVAGLAALMVGLIAACGGGDDPTPTTSSPLGATPTATAPVLEASEVQWNETLEAANREGSMVVAITRQGYREGAELFMNFFPDINLEFQVGRGQEQRWLIEYDAGIHSVDVSLTGSSSMMEIMMPAGFLENIKNVTFLPEVVDDENWIGVRDDHFAPCAFAPGSFLSKANYHRTSHFRIHFAVPEPFLPFRDFMLSPEYSDSHLSSTVGRRSRPYA